MDNETQIKRITEMEQALDKTNEALDKLLARLEEYKGCIPLITKLMEYSQRDEWMEDFECDEDGLLPRDLKRGVLSEDGIYSLLEKKQDIRDIIRTLFTE